MERVTSMAEEEKVKEFIEWLNDYLDETTSENTLEEYTESECLKKASEWLAVASELVETNDANIDSCLERVSWWLEKASKIAMKNLKGVK